MINWILRIAFFSLLIPNVSAQKSVAITIDDLPVVPYGVGIESQEMITKNLLKHLLDYDVPAMGFVNEIKLFENHRLIPAKVAMLEDWLSSGMELGNHTYNHLNYHNASLEEYVRQIVRGDSITSGLCERFESPLRYFRHPYLRIGKSAEDHKALVAALSELGYTEAPVTIDNADYLFAAAYAKALQMEDNDLSTKIAADYLKYMVRVLLYYERNSQDLFTRNIPHILLLHANQLNADLLGDLLRLYQSNGYQFSSLTEVLKDPAYTTDITTYGNYGISWIHRWALSQEKAKDFFRGEPEVPAYLGDILGGD